MGGADAYWPGGHYDAYKKDSIFAEKTKPEIKDKKKKKKKKKESSSSSSDSEGSSNEEVEKPKRFKKGLTKPPKKGADVATV